MYEICWCLVTYVVAAAAVYAAAVWSSEHATPSLPRGRTLFVIAHPDDEAMFFAPTILSLTAADPTRVHLLCLTCGNYRQEGPVRTQELWESCRRLSIPSANILMLNSSYFPDDPFANWDSTRLSDILLNHIETLDIAVVVTFDEEGVSGHINHISINRAILQLVSRNRLPSGCRAFALDSVNIFRKYSAMLDMFPALLVDRCLHVASPSRRACAVHSMSAYRSQMVWFRRLYVLFSRYMWLNTFTEVTEDFSLECE